MADSPRIEELKRRVHSDPASIAFAALAEEYRRAGRFEEAIATCNTGLQRHPSYLSAHVTLGRALLEVGRFDEAQQELEYVLKLAPENLAAIRGLAEIHHRKGDDAAHGTEMALPREQPAVTPKRAELPRQAPIPVPELQLDATPPAPEAPPDLRLAPEPEAAPAPHVEPNAPIETAPPIDAAALAGLEQFLASIQRSRAARQPASR